MISSTMILLLFTQADISPRLSSWQNGTTLSGKNQRDHHHALLFSSACWSDKTRVSLNVMVRTIETFILSNPSRKEGTDYRRWFAVDHRLTHPCIRRMQAGGERPFWSSKDRASIPQTRPTAFDRDMSKPSKEPLIEYDSTMQPQR